MNSSRSGPRLPVWALPGALAALEGAPAGRRTLRDWGADVALFLVAVLIWVSTLPQVALAPDADYEALVPGWMITADPWVGAVACVLLWCRRRWPAAVAVAMVPMLTVSGTAIGAVLISLFTLAVHRGWLPTAAVIGLQLGQVVPFALMYQPPGMSTLGSVVNSTLPFAVALAAGAVVRFRRQLLANLRREADLHRQQYARQLEEARRGEREQIAREMHDVLAHRISMLSVHAGALAYRSARAAQGAGAALAPTEVADAAQVIRENAHRALTELGEVLTVLRAGESAAGAWADHAPHRLTDLERLVSEAAAAGQRIDVTTDPAVVAAGPPERLQHTIYRVVREGLTNARKHAPAAPVSIQVAGAPGETLEVTVRNPLSVTPPRPGEEAAIPGGGTGLAGLAERVELHGGTLRQGVYGDEFRLWAQLPWQDGTDRPGAGAAGGRRSAGADRPADDVDW